MRISKNENVNTVFTIFSQFNRKFYLLSENKNKNNYYMTENFTFQNRKHNAKLFVSSVPTERKGKMYCTTRISGYFSSRR